MTEPRPVECCGKCPPIQGGGYDCTCKGNPRCKRQKVTWGEKRQARRIQRLRDRRNDYWHWLWYARLSLSPSQVRKAEAYLAKLGTRLDEMLEREDD